MKVASETAVSTHHRLRSFTIHGPPDDATIPTFLERSPSTMPRGPETALKQR